VHNQWHPCFPAPLTCSMPHGTGEAIFGSTTRNLPFCFWVGHLLTMSAAGNVAPLRQLLSACSWVPPFYISVFICWVSLTALPSSSSPFRSERVLP
jgi:hypothetical protein